MNLENTHPRSTENTRQSTPAELDKLQVTTPPLDIVSGKLMEDLLSIDSLFIASDDLATTFISAGLVLLTASLLNTWTAESLASSSFVVTNPIGKKRSFDKLMDLAQWAAANALGKPESEWLMNGRDVE